MLALYMSIIDDNSHRHLFEKIYLNYRKQMFLVARSVLDNDLDAEDVIHDVFLKIAKKHMEKISQIENDVDLRNYLLKATKNAALDHIRKHRRELFFTEAEDDITVQSLANMTDNSLVDQICSHCEYEMVVAAITSLKPIYRDVLYCHFVLELSVTETSTMLNCKISTAKQRLMRGKKLLYAQLFKGDNSYD